MKVVIINKSDQTGGAAVVSRRLMLALRAEGVDARMLVCEKLTASPFVELAASPQRIHASFLTERLKIYAANGFDRSTLFKMDTCSDGLPLWRHRLVKEADVICLGWINQGMLSFSGLCRLIDSGKPIVWTMHDMWNMTGICHHAGHCRHFEDHCGNCPLLGRKASATDLSSSVWRKKHDIYAAGAISFVAVSRWLREKAMQSSLLSGQEVCVIPNPFSVLVDVSRSDKNDGKMCILMGAARLDDTVKGLPLLVEATKILASRNPDLASRLELLTFGGVKDPQALKDFGIRHRHLGHIGNARNLAETYAGADLVVSSSLYESWGATLAEGQAYGCVPVSFDRGGQGDIIDDGLTGVLVPFDDNPDKAAAALAEGIVRGVELASDPAVKVRMRRSVEEKFGFSSVANRYMELFNTLIERRQK